MKRHARLKAELTAVAPVLLEAAQLAQRNAGKIKATKEVKRLSLDSSRNRMGGDLRFLTATDFLVSHAAERLDPHLILRSNISQQSQSKYVWEIPEVEGSFIIKQRPHPGHEYPEYVDQLSLSAENKAQSNDALDAKLVAYFCIPPVGEASIKVKVGPIIEESYLLQALIEETPAKVVPFPYPRRRQLPAPRIVPQQPSSESAEPSS